VHALRAQVHPTTVKLVFADQILFKKYMAIIDCTSAAGPEDTSSEGGVAISDKLRTIADIMATLNATNTTDAHHAENVLAKTEACHWFVLPDRSMYIPY
jgi:hypothetical protein